MKVQIGVNYAAARSACRFALWRNCHWDSVSASRQLAPPMVLAFSVMSKVGELSLPRLIPYRASSETSEPSVF